MNDVKHLANEMNTYIMYGAGYSSEENVSPFGNIVGMVGAIGGLLGPIGKIFNLWRERATNLRCSRNYSHVIRQVQIPV